MKAFILLAYMGIGGAIGWWLGDKGGFLAAYLLSVVGSSIGFYLGRKLIREHLE